MNISSDQSLMARIRAPEASASFTARVCVMEIEIGMKIRSPHVSRRRWPGAALRREFFSRHDKSDDIASQRSCRTGNALGKSGRVAIGDYENALTHLSPSVHLCEPECAARQHDFFHRNPPE
jgi:hypothetical protein